MNHDEIVILDFGSQYSHLIARRVRGNLFFSCLITRVQRLLRTFLLPCRCQGSDGKEESQGLGIHSVVLIVQGIIFSGGPCSVYEKDAPHVSEELWKFIEEKNIPLLGICYGLQEIAHHYGGVVASCDHREYGHAMVGVVKGLNSIYILVI